MHMESSSKHLSGAPQKKKAKKSPQYGFIPPDEGEDDVSYERHVRCMKVEFSKRRANGAFVACPADEAFLWAQEKLDLGRST